MRNHVICVLHRIQFPYRLFPKFTNILSYDDHTTPNFNQEQVC